MHTEIDSPLQIPGLSRRDWLRLAAVSTMGPWALMGDGISGDATAAEAGRVLAAEQVLKDARLGKLKDYDGYFPWEPSSSTAEWLKRAEVVRRQVQVACGLWPLPEKPPLNPVIHGKVERDDYTVERVFFETHRGLHVTGSLYRPLGKSGKLPAVLSPHGHWANGRFHDHGEAGVKKEIATEAETFPIGGRHPLQARCVQLARMGCVVFLYDMLGYADNLSLGYELIHRFAKQRPELSAPDNWGLFSAQSELRCLNALGIQTWNGIRAFDFLSSLPDVDASRIGVTGASGGGTQTFLLGIVDPRPAAFFPAVMVSTAMQGGCTCENASYLRIGTGNIEFAAMIAPRPLGMSAADDWTKELETKGLPQLKQHFTMLHVGDKVEGKYFPYPHNYNAPSRAMMYAFFNKHLQLGITEPIVERDFVPLTKEEATVWNDTYPAPASGLEAEQKVLLGFDSAWRKQFAALLPKSNDSASAKRFEEIIGGAWDVLIGRSLPGKEEITETKLGRHEHEGFREFHSLLKIERHGEEVPAVFLLPDNWNKNVVLWFDSRGKQALWNAEGKPISEVKQLLSAGVAIASIDVLSTGEFLPNGEPLQESRVVPNPRQFGGYTWGYNHPLFAQRVHDVLTAIAFTVHHDSQPGAIDVVGRGEAGLWVASAARIAGKAIRKVAVSIDDFRFNQLTNIRDPRMLPGAVKYGDVPALLAFCGTRPLFVHSPLDQKAADESLTLLRTLDAATNSTRPLTTAVGDQGWASLPKWLLS